MQRLEAFIRDIDIWMVKKQNKTKLGEDKRSSTHTRLDFRTNILQDHCKLVE